MIIRVNSTSEQPFVISAAVPEDTSKYDHYKEEAAAIAHLLATGLPHRVYDELFKCMKTIDALQINNEPRAKLIELINEYKQHAEAREIK